MLHEKFNNENLINLIINNDVEGLKSFISDILSVIDENLETICRNKTTLQALEAAGFEKVDQYKKLYEANKDLKGTNSIYMKLHSQARAAFSKF